MGGGEGRNIIRQKQWSTEKSTRNVLVFLVLHTACDYLGRPVQMKSKGESEISDVSLDLILNLSPSKPDLLLISTRAKIASWE